MSEPCPQCYGGDAGECLACGGTGVTGVKVTRLIDISTDELTDEWGWFTSRQGDYARPRDRKSYPTREAALKAARAARGETREDGE